MESTRSLRVLLVLGFAATMAMPHGEAASWPERPIRVVVPLAPGGSVDTVARLVSARLTDHLGQQFVVDNRPGAGGTIGTSIVATAEPDGHTLLMMSGAFAASAALYDKLPYDPIRDIAPIALIASGPFWLVAHPSLGPIHLHELIELARTKPDALSYGSGGVGSSTHLAMEYFSQTTQTRIMHVPYKGGGAAIADLLSGRIQLYMAPGPLIMPHVKSGKLRALGVTSAQRSADMPDVPPITEFVPGYVVAFPYGIGAPGRTPRKIILKLNETLGSIVKEAEIVARLRAGGNEPSHMSPEAFARATQQEIEKWKTVVKKGSIKVE
jgi:tripartite-type tricarboxylate transporter receptor subunit TctC